MKSCAISIRKLSLVFVVAVLLASPCSVHSDLLESAKTDKELAREALNPTAPYCGVQAVYLAARAINKEVDFSQMVQSQYIGSKQGSTLSELQSLCDALQLKTKRFSHLTVNSLYGAVSPIILHTSAQADLKNYDHWTLFTGIEDGKATTWQVVNGQSTREVISLGDLTTQ